MQKFHNEPTWVSRSLIFLARYWGTHTEDGTTGTITFCLVGLLYFASKWNIKAPVKKFSPLLNSYATYLHTCIVIFCMWFLPYFWIFCDWVCILHGEGHCLHAPFMIFVWLIILSCVYLTNFDSPFDVRPHPTVVSFWPSYFLTDRESKGRQTGWT